MDRGDRKTLTSAPSVVLLQPSGACTSFTRSGSVYPPLGLCQLAATVAPDRCGVLDADALGLSADETVDRILRTGARAVGMTATSYGTDLVATLAGMLDDAGVAVIVGGPHATLCPEDILERCAGVRYVVRGEAEGIFPSIVSRIERGLGLDGLPSVCHREGGRVVISSVVPRIADFEAIPFPRFDGLPLDRYWCPDALPGHRPLVTVMTSRGCPYGCAFCSSQSLFGSTPRAWCVGAILDHLDHLVRDLGVREVSFVDDGLTLLRARAMDLCRGMVDRNLDLAWFCNARADAIDDGLAEAMARAGCHQVYLGFESGSQAILDGIGKRVRVERMEQAAAVLTRHGIARSVGFVVGLPGETDGTVGETIDLAQRVRPERIQFTRFTPLIGSRLGDQAASSGGFHDHGHDRVGAWVQQCRAACAGSGWGRESW